MLEILYRLSPIVFFFVTISFSCEAQLYQRVDATAEISGLDKALVFDVDLEALKALSDNRSQNIKVNLPFFDEKELSLNLKAIQLHTDDFNVVDRTASGDVNNKKYKPGQYYKGTILGVEQSQAIISIQGEEISGVINIGETEYNLGKIRNQQSHVLYDVSDIDAPYEMSCATLPKFETPEELDRRRTTCAAVVEIYFECDYQMYQNFNSNTTSVINYVNTLFAQVANLYSNENITLQLSQVVVWNAPDGYASGTAGLSDFASANNSSGFNGDLGHLLTNDTGSNGGVAYVDQLCGNFPYAYSDILNTAHAYPTYSWDVQVVTHEMGHNFGSSHTHDCVWGPNNDQQIDDCGSVVIGGGSCYNASTPIIPSGGGTIMSYCHLNSVGINFSNGFGTEPGDLIRQEHSSCMCDNASCAQATVLTTGGTYNAQPSSGNGAQSANASHADWFVFTPSTPGNIDIYSCHQGVDTRVHIYTGQCNNLNFEITSDDDCTSANSSNYASEILSFPVSTGVSYYIEWDSRWSTASFDWEFAFVPSAPSSTTVALACPPDYNGINNCSPSSYSTSITGSAATVANAALTYSDVITNASCSMLINRTWSAHLNGTTSSCVQNIDLDDTVAPVVTTCPAAMNLTTDTSCQALVTWPTPTGTDLCSPVSSVSNYASGTYFFPGSYTVNHTFSDLCGNTATCSFSLTVIDGCNSNLDDCDGVNLLLSGSVQDDIHNAEVALDANGVILNGTNPIFKAGESMELLPGFELELGATLEMIIEDCQN